MPRCDINRKYYYSYLSYTGETIEDTKKRLLAKRKKFGIALKRKGIIINRKKPCPLQ